MKTVFFSCASDIGDHGFVEKMRAMRDAVFSAPGVESDRTCCTFISADLFVGILDYWSEQLDVQIRVRASLQKPLTLFHPAGTLPSAVLERLVTPYYPAPLAARIFRPYASASDVAEEVVAELYPNGKATAPIARVVC